jgi:hypothetical protein
MTGSVRRRVEGSERENETISGKPFSCSETVYAPGLQGNITLTKYFSYVEIP